MAGDCVLVIDEIKKAMHSATDEDQEPIILYLSSYNTRLNTFDTGEVGQA